MASLSIRHHLHNSIRLQQLNHFASAGEMTISLNMPSRNNRMNLIAASGVRWYSTRLISLSKTNGPCIWHYHWKYLSLYLHMTMTFQVSKHSTNFVLILNFKRNLICMDLEPQLLQISNKEGFNFLINLTFMTIPRKKSRKILLNLLIVW